jgi:hypothetical protein
MAITCMYRLSRQRDRKGEAMEKRVRVDYLTIEQIMSMHAMFGYEFICEDGHIDMIMHL